MTRLNASLVGIVALTLVAGSESVQGQCVIFEDPADMFRTADAVFVGTVRRTEPTGALGHHIVMHRASFEIEQVWKGQVKKFETVGTVEAFDPGKRYLVFAGASEESRGREGSFQTSLECGWAQIESDAARNLRWLRGNVGSPLRVRDN